MAEVKKKAVKKAMGNKPPKVQPDYSNGLKAGQQVALYSDRNGLRYGYEYLKSSKAYHTLLKLETGKEVRVLHDKTFTMDAAKKVEREIDEHNAKLEKASKTA